MRSPRRVLLAVAALSWAYWSCGGADVRGTIDTMGGEVCTADGSVCLRVPVGGLERALTVRIVESLEGPPAALSRTWALSVASGPAPVFLQPAQVVFRLEGLALDPGLDPEKLRVSLRVGEDWPALSGHRLDRVRGEVLGETTSLGTFTLLRADRLPDGTLPPEVDAGTRPDSGVIVVPPPVDAGKKDAGVVDAGAPDAGRPDAGPGDAGTGDAGPPDAGAGDAGVADAGAVDAGPGDSGLQDAGTLDAGAPDAGADPDAGAGDAGAADSGTADAGDAG